MGFDYASLITDRSDTDVGSDELRGSYDFRALNRVTGAMEDLNRRFAALGYLTGYVPVMISHLDGTSSTVWMEDDEDIQLTRLESYRANVAALRQVLTLVESTPQAPADMDLLTVEEANAIEQILVNIDETLIRMATTFVACGPATCGGDYL